MLAIYRCKRCKYDAETPFEICPQCKSKEVIKLFVHYEIPRSSIVGIAGNCGITDRDEV